MSEDEIKQLAEAFNECNEYGNGHIVFADGNLEDSHITFCLSLKDDDERELSDNERTLLKNLLLIPLENRGKVWDLALKLRAERRMP